MASPAELMETVSGATGVPLPTIVDIDRRLVKGQLRTKGGRGLNAAKMTPLDAARLLTAVLASPQANRSAEAVTRYAQTRVDRSRSSDELFGAARLEDLGSLPARHSFIDALGALIASAATGSLAMLMARSDDGWTPRIEVFALTRATRGRIRISGLPNTVTASVEYVAASVETKHRPAKKTGRDRVAIDGESIGDLEQSRRITERTILPVAKLLAQGEPS